MARADRVEGGLVRAAKIRPTTGHGWRLFIRPGCGCEPCVGCIGGRRDPIRFVLATDYESVFVFDASVSLSLASET
jgi:hypothetical protein